jgi:hypothetical protein
LELYRRVADLSFERTTLHLSTCCNSKDVQIETSSHEQTDYNCLSVVPFKPQMMWAPLHGCVKGRE